MAVTAVWALGGGGAWGRGKEKEGEEVVRSRMALRQRKLLMRGNQFVILPLPNRANGHICHMMPVLLAVARCFKHSLAQHAHEPSR